MLDSFKVARRNLTGDLLVELLSELVRHRCGDRYWFGSIVFFACIEICFPSTRESGVVS